MGAIPTRAVMTNSDEVMQATIAFLIDMVLIGRNHSGISQVARMFG